MRTWIFLLGLALLQLGCAPGALPSPQQPLAAALASAPSAAEKPDPSRQALYRGVFDRLLVLLEEIPERWQKLPPPRPEPSGRSPEQVLEAASQEERSSALDAISSLALAPLEERPALVEALLTGREPSEVDLWVPFELSEAEKVRSREEAALTVEAWLAWAEALGRKDVLFQAASSGAALVYLRADRPRELAAALASWATLEAPAGERGKASLLVSEADVLFLLGQNPEALAAYRSARSLFQAVGDRLGEGNTWLGEADVLFLLGQNPEALAA
ncbi:MAG TPA: tetratricopeptide repeat protein, partial [Thermoanaerobaculia bacterium]|nr:tetratricopeptide repeat protein [Thermoanaerobaculia bacterium]